MAPLKRSFSDKSGAPGVVSRLSQVEPAGAKERVVARKFNLLAQVIDGGGQPAVVGQFMDRTVKRLVSRKKLLDVTRRIGRFQRFVEGLKLRCRSLIKVLGRQLRCVPLKQDEYGKNVIEVL